MSFKHGARLKDKTANFLLLNLDKMEVLVLSSNHTHRTAINHNIQASFQSIKHLNIDYVV